eukprot:CAMPEP_0201510714 /NCGR_PEP_ID=MMETSP0161_2-20130828/3298_1 /ASSEMBLY_ACC=CAM_ASM_000251 /TAXON_ID=180227 /ORGANISM="Neoparamoeba aestuarina, Strain SoJaBio B1-5/56/2" /LENGTH=232 /DNA_ID=CAMNT_0047905931 /DNA_START=77 /DNA_END=775 /DNA_ORIENTATION=+
MSWSDSFSSLSGWAKKAASSAASALMAEDEMPWHSYLPPRTDETFAEIDEKIAHQVILLSLQPEAFCKPIDGDAEFFCDFIFNFDEWEEVWIPLCFQVDPRLQATAERLIPKQVSEHDFWRNYASHIHLIAKTILQAVETERKERKRDAEEEERERERKGLAENKEEEETFKITLPADEPEFYQELEQFEHQLHTILSSKESEKVGIEVSEEEANAIFQEIEKELEGHKIKS